jgi:outer membrane receptor for ferrienterochelin and colicin
VTYGVLNIPTAGPIWHDPFGWGRSYPQYTIPNQSLTDVTDLVQDNGTITVSSRELSNAQYYSLQAYYTAQPLGRELAAWSNNPTTIFQNGSVAVDHFSTTGAKVITDFLEDYVLDEETVQLFQEVGRYFWEDSVEIDGKMYWTPGLRDIFHEKYGVRYSPTTIGYLLINRAV